MTFEQLLAIRIDWLGLILIGVLLGELARMAIRLFKKEKPPNVVPFIPTRNDPTATLPIKVVRLEETRVDSQDEDEWDKQQGRFW